MFQCFCLFNLCVFVSIESLVSRLFVDFHIVSILGSGTLFT